jgi:hypothetical protein
MPSILGDAPEWFEPRAASAAVVAIGRLLDDPQAARAAVLRGRTVVEPYRADHAGAALVAVFANAYRRGY